MMKMACGIADDFFSLVETIYIIFEQTFSLKLN